MRPRPLGAACIVGAHLVGMGAANSVGRGKESGQ
jgi:hypothetical protein